jgi:hypothetical protein
MRTTRVLKVEEENKSMKRLAVILFVLSSAIGVVAQQNPSGGNERPVSLTEAAVALDSGGASVLQASLRTTPLNGAPDSPVANIRLLVRNTSPIAYSFVSGVVTFYDANAVRCGEGVFKADAVAANESFETDSPGIRIRCVPATWRIVATSLVPRLVPSPATEPNSPARNLIISVDGEQHPIQLDKPMTLTLGEKQRTIIVREAP